MDTIKYRILKRSAQITHTLTHYTCNFRHNNYNGLQCGLSLQRWGNRQNRLPSAHLRRPVNPRLPTSISPPQTQIIRIEDLNNLRLYSILHNKQTLRDAIEEQIVRGLYSWQVHCDPLIFNITQNADSQSGVHQFFYGGAEMVYSCTQRRYTSTVGLVISINKAGNTAAWEFSICFLSRSLSKIHFCYGLLTSTQYRLHLRYKNW